MAEDTTSGSPTFRSQFPDRPFIMLSVGDAKVRETLGQLLGADCSVLIAQESDTGALALEGAPAVLFFDGIGGAFARALREQEDTASISIVRVLNSDEEPSADDIRLRPDGYLYQPISQCQLLAMTESLVALARQNREMARLHAERDEILDHVNEAFLAVDSDWRITHLNAAAEQAVQVQREAAIGQNAWEVFPESTLAERAPIYRRVMQEREPAKLEAYRPDSGWFDIDAVPLRDGGLAVFFRNSTSLRKAEAAALASERRLRLFLEHAKDYALALLDAEGLVLEWLGGAEKITGWAPGEVRGVSAEIIFIPAERATGRFADELGSAATSGSAEDKRWHQRKDGSRFFAEGITTAFRNEVGQLQGFAKIFRDATGERIAEDALRESREQLQKIMDATADGICGLAADGTCTFVNPAAAEMLGYAPEELIGRVLHGLIHHHRSDGSVYPAEECRIIRAVREGRKIEVTDEVFWRKDGSSFPVRYTVNPIIGIDGVVGAAFAFSDVTETKRAEAALRASERTLRFVMDSMPQKLFISRPDGSLEYVNPAWTTYTGESYDALRDGEWTRHIHPDDVERNVRRWQQSIDAAEPFQIEHRIRNAQGEYRWHLSRSQPLRNDSGEVVMWIGSNTDIHEVKQSEAILAEELAAEKRGSALLADIAAASHEINAVLSVDAVVRVLTEKVGSILGVQQVEVVLLEEQELCLVDDDDLHPNPNASATTDQGTRQHASSTRSPTAVERARSAQSGFDDVDRNSHLEHREGRRNSLVTALFDHKHKQLGLIRVAQKIEGEFTEEDAVVLDQLAVIAAAGIENACLYDSLREQDQRKDEFLATLAHELRNPLAPLRTGLDLLKLPRSGQASEKVRAMMERQLTHMVRLVDDLMDVSRVSRGRVELKHERVQIEAVFRTALEAIGPQVEASEHELAVFPAQRSLEVLGDLTRLAQVLTNLLSNAVKYTPRGGRIELKAEEEDDQVIIRVRDTGEGIPDELLTKVFELFTQVSPGTDRSRGGLGIGLALVQKLVELHGGRVWAESPGLGSGSTFTVALPLLLEESKPTAESDDEGDSLPKSGRRILVVDDNTEAAETLSMLLEYLGHYTVVAHSGPEAVKAAVEFAPAAVILDIGLPGMSGYEVAVALRKDVLPRDAVLIALTGWGGEEDRRRSEDAGFDFHLTKPVDLKTLMATLDRFFPPGKQS